MQNWFNLHDIVDNTFYKWYNDRRGWKYKMESRKEQRELRRREKLQREENKKLFLKRNNVETDESLVKEKKVKEKKVKEPKEKKVKEKKPFQDTKSKRIIRIVTGILTLVATVILIITFVRGVKLNDDLNLIPAKYMKILYYYKALVKRI